MEPPNVREQLIERRRFIAFWIELHSSSTVAAKASQTRLLILCNEGGVSQSYNPPGVRGNVLLMHLPPHMNQLVS
jgi:hypothetical protein